MATFYISNVEVNVPQITAKTESIIDDVAMMRIHAWLGMCIYDYVPNDEGHLAGEREHPDATKDYLRYGAPYAHYQYMGDVYAPNYPITEDGKMHFSAQGIPAGSGQVVGWRSPKGKGSKHKTERKLGKDGVLKNDAGEVIWEFGYNRDRSPLVTSEWDKVALSNPEVKAKFLKGVAEILNHRMRELYGN